MLKNAGFKVSGVVGTNNGNRGDGAVQFLVARHEPLS
jgi:hypothetical protein